MYSVIVENGFGCADTSNSVEVIVVLAPAIPTITVFGDTLRATPADSWQWFRNGLPVPGAVNRDYISTTTAFYQVEVTNAAGCTEISDSLDMVVASQDLFLTGLTVFPNPFRESFQVRAELASGGEMDVLLYNVTGQVVYQRSLKYAAGSLQMEVDAGSLAAGLYLLELRSANGNRA